MSQERVAILPLLIKAIGDIDKYHPNGIAVSQPSLLVPRGQILEVYNEGKLFSGMESVRKAECCVAPTPAPHITAYIPTQTYLDAASEIFKNDSRLYPKYDNVNYVSPQVTLWWRRKGDVKPFDFTNMYKLNQNEQSDFCLAISNKTKQGVELITKLRGKPIIWGTWGYGTVEEREKEGLTRGGPTLKEGHLHVSYFDPDEQKVFIQQISGKDKLNHYAPWNRIILERFGSSLSEFLSKSFKNLSDKHIGLTIKMEEKIDVHSNSSASILNGFKINFEKSIPLRYVLSGLVDMAGRSEDVYNNIHRLFNLYNKHQDIETKTQMGKQMQNLFQEIGFTKQKSKELTTFIFSIQPTYGQLVSYKGQLIKEPHNVRDLAKLNDRIKKYEKIRYEISKMVKKNLLMNMVEDIVKEPSAKDISFTFSVHSSYCYIIRNYTTKDGEIYVDSLNLYPEFATTESGPERVLGVVLKRTIINP